MKHLRWLRLFVSGIAAIPLLVGQAPLLRDALAADQQGPSFGALGERLEDARKSELFKWFHLELVDAEGRPDGAGSSFFRPSGPAFRQLVLLRVSTDPQGQMRSLHLAIKRSFIDDPKNGPFARDIAKSFLRIATPEGDRDRIIGLANEIEFDPLGGRVLRATPSPPIPAEPTPGYRTFLGNSSSLLRPYRRPCSNCRTPDRETTPGC